MKNTYIIAIVILILAVGGFIAFENRSMTEVPAAPVQPVTQSDDMTPTPSPSPNETTPASPVKTEVKVPAPVTAPVKEFTVTGKNFSFTPSILTVKKGDKVKITFKNENGMHNLIIDEFHVGTKTISSGTSETIEFTADKTGSFQYYCSVGSHRAMGMWGTLKVE